jgi:hypothetical protein
MSVTFDTFQLLIFPLKNLAPLNISDIFVTLFRYNSSVAEIDEKETYANCLPVFARRTFHHC